MKVLLLVMLLSVFSFATPLSESSALEKDITDGKLVARTERALDSIILQAGKELRKRGHGHEADQMETEYFNEYKYTFKAFMLSRDIGDHPDQIFSQWLEDKINMLTMVLGMQVMKVTHLIDLKIFNDTPKIVFRPCTFGMNNVTGERIDEYRRNFAEGAELYGLLPVVSFWGCVAGTFSAGYAIICSPVEFLVGRFAAPRLSDIIFHKACDSKT